jgi:hypothetical protein
MLNKMNKKILSETAVYTGVVELPSPIEINLESLRADILLFNNGSESFPFSKSLSIFQTYIRNFCSLEHSMQLVEKNTFGDIYKPGEYSYPLIQADLMDLKNSCDFVVLYGVNVEKDSCKIRIEYDNNRLKNNYIDLPLETNKFIIFPSTLIYYISPNTSGQLNFILTTLYELK